MNKKLLVITLFALTCLTCCTVASESFLINFGIEYTEESVDIKSLDNYFLNNKEKYPSYIELKNDQPELLNHTKYVKVEPAIAKRNIKVIRFSSKDNGGLDNTTYLRLNNNYYPLGESFGGWGVTEFVYQKVDKHEWLYFLYSCGSGIHRSFVDAIDLSNGIYYSVIGIETMDAFIDYTFEIDEENNIDLYEAEIFHAYDEEGYDLFNIAKKELAIENINTLEHHPIDL